MASLEIAQAEWLEKLEAMRRAIAELLPPSDAEKIPAYGDDLDVDDDELSGSGDDIWDIVEDNYDEYSSDHLDQFEDDQPAKALYDQQWLAERCSHVARGGAGLDGGALKEQISAILVSDSNGAYRYTIPVALSAN